MTIRRRLARSNLVMILIPVAIAAVLLLLGGVAKDEAVRTQFKLCLKILYLFLSVWSILRRKGNTAQFGKQIRREIFRQAKI